MAAIIESLTLRPTLPGESEGVFRARAHVKLRDGTSLTVDMPYAPGHKLNPIDEAGMAGKYRGFAAPAIGEAKAERILDICLDRQKDARVRDILAFCASGS